MKNIFPKPIKFSIDCIFDENGFSNSSKNANDSLYCASSLELAIQIVEGTIDSAPKRNKKDSYFLELKKTVSNLKNLRDAYMKHYEKENE